MVEQLRRDFVQGPAFDLQGYLGIPGGRGGVGAGGRIEPTQFPGGSPGNINVNLGGGGGGGMQQAYQPSAMDSLLEGFGTGAGQSLATGIPEKVLEFQRERKREKSLSIIDKALKNRDFNDPQSVLDGILHAKGADSDTRNEVANTYLAGQKAQNERMAKLAPQMKNELEQQQAQQQGNQFQNAMDQASGIEEQPPQQLQYQQEMSPQELAMQQQQLQQQEARAVEMQPSPKPTTQKIPAISLVKSTKLPDTKKFNEAIRTLPPAEKKIAIDARNRIEDMEYKHVMDSFEKTKDYRDTIEQHYKAALSTSNTLNEMEALVKNGNLSSPMKIHAMELLGLPISSFGTVDDELFQKHSETLMKGVSGAYKGRLLEFELESWAKTIPRLVNSDEAKLEVIKNKQLEDKIKIIEYEAANRITILNGGLPPLNINELVTQEIDPIVKKLYSQEQEPDFVEMIHPSTGKTMKISRDGVEEALRLGAKFANE